MGELNNLRVAVLATDGFEESELNEPIRVLKEAGAKVDVIAPKSGQIQGFRHHDKSINVPVDQTRDDAKPEAYDALVLPGGALNADAIRAVPAALAFIRAIRQAGKPIAAICHAPWALISAGIIRGRTVTSYHTIEDDVRNAGAHWIDREVVVDETLITSRQPSDLPAFNREIIRAFSCAAQSADR
jgi:protease I